MRFALVIAVAFLLACSSMARSGHLYSATDNYMEGKYEKAIRDADWALNTGDPTPEQRARANLIKAQSLEKLGEVDAAIGLYQYIVDSFPEAPDAYQARQRLKHLERSDATVR